MSSEPQLQQPQLPPFLRSGGDDDLFLMDTEFLLLKEDVHQSQHHSHNNNCAGPNTSNAMDAFDHVDSLLLGFDLDASLDHSPFENSALAPNGFGAMTNGGSGLALHRAESSFDGSASPTTTDEMSGSEMSSPPPSFDVSPASSPVRLAPAPTQRGSAVANPGAANNNYSNTAAVRMAPAITSAMNAFAAASALPYAMPVAYYPSQPVAALNVSQKRPFQPDVLPSAPASVVVPDTASDTLSDAKKSKREIRQMKNRESANKSRLRRKAQMSELSDEVSELTKKQHELENTIAALRAENKSLHDQNAFLRSLVTKPGGAGGSSSSIGVFPSLPQPLQQQQQQQQQQQTQQVATMPSLGDTCTNSLSAMENGQQQQQLEFAPQKKLKTSRATTFSAASLSLCASVFGVTLFSDYDGGAGESSHIRRPGRVLHSLPATVDAGFTPVPSSSFTDLISDTLAGSWAYVSSSELAFGVFLNVLSFVVIMGLYHAWQSSFTLPTPGSVQRRWAAAAAAGSRGGAARASRKERTKRRSVSWQDIRLRDAADGSGDAIDCTSGRETARLAHMRDLL